jgi:hypothetical protein
MSKLPEGYEVIELSGIEPLVRCKSHQGLATAILGWICDSVQKEFNAESERFVIEPICVQYSGAYPAIGIRYLTQEAYDSATLSTELQNAATRRVQECSIVEFVSYVAGSDESCDSRFQALCAK